MIAVFEVFNKNIFGIRTWIHNISQLVQLRYFLIALMANHNCWLHWLANICSQKVELIDQQQYTGIYQFTTADLLS